MFPPSLQKNIQELDRQISLLETECENMESEKKDFKINQNIALRDLPNKPFITSPMCATSTFAKKGMPPIVPKMYSPGMRQKPGRKPNESIKTPQDSKDSFKNGGEEGTSWEPVVTTPKTSPRDGKDLSVKRSISSITEVSETSDEELAKQRRNMLKKSSKGPLWSEIFSHQATSTAGVDKKTKNKESEELKQQPAERSSSDEEPKKDVSYNDTEELTSNETRVKEIGHPSPLLNISSSKKRRRRSTRTRKNIVNDIPVDVNFTKSLNEKEIQCMIWNEEREKTEFLVNLHDSITTLHLLIADLKTKTSQDKRNEVLSDMQNTLLKITGVKSMNALNDPLSLFSCLKPGERFNFLQGDDKEVAQFKKALLGVKKFCEELTNEKSTLSDELNIKNKTVAYLKNKEKEYLSLISSLKFNLEKTKEEAEEGARAKKNLMFVRSKLQEELKVAEALKKSHAKMQELIENYVMENDQLKTQLKIAKLEAQKFNVLLAGRDEEVKKYKGEIEMFQRQISQQLNILRSKAGVVTATEAIKNQTNLFSQTESYLSDTTLGKHEFLEQSYTLSSKTSVDSNWTNKKNRMKEAINSMSNEMEYSETKKQESTNCKSERSFPATTEGNDIEKKFECEELDEALAKSRNLRSNIDEILQDIRCKSSQTSYNISQYTMLSTSSENTSEYSQKV